METIKDLVERLNAMDEGGNIEAKKASDIDRSVMETVCALSNEPGMGGGYILLGVERDESSLFPFYTVTGISNPDKVKTDFATQCANMFNLPVRPDMETEQMNNGKVAIKVWVPELDQAQKPLYFKNEGLPRGAFRRISSTDQRCTEDDLYVFYNNTDTLDSSVVRGSSLSDISEDALELYRKLRNKVNPYAEELGYNNIELLLALGCIKKESDEWVLTYTGLLVFGNRMALRRLLPMVRVDYIRVPGNEWVSDPENRFTTTDMRGPLIELVQRTFNAIADDLPKGFLLPEGQVQAESIGLPVKVLREAIVNAFIHRTYRENQPIQIIRYGNRIEIKNPGFSLKPEEQLGEPGSKNRNPFIAAIFHETNLAETKGSGIRTMRTLMEQANMVPPTFESDHSSNTFTARLLLHHFLSEADIKWLGAFDPYNLSDAQKRALIFVREAGAIDNGTYRQINGCDILKASAELRQMRDGGLLEQKGKGRATYYIPGYAFSLFPAIEQGINPLPDQSGALPDQSGALPDQLPAPIEKLLAELGRRTTDKEKMNQVLVELCGWKPHTLKQLSAIVSRNEKYLLENFITPLREAGNLEYTIPDMPNHPEQAYQAKK